MNSSDRFTRSRIITALSEFQTFKMNRIILLIYSICSYLLMLAVALSAVCFIGNLGLTRTLDHPASASFIAAILINCSSFIAVVLVYKILRTARGQRYLDMHVPSPVKRSTRVLIFSVLTLIIIWRWQPSGIVVWSIEDSATQAFLQIAYFSGCSIVFVSTFLLNHLELFGLRQAWCFYRKKEYTHSPMLVPGHHQLVRHPFYIGFLLFVWSAPVMTIVHLLLAIAVTGYIMLAIQKARKIPVYRLRNPYMRYGEGSAT
jgi:protein-S-isoprenylcysteine O-methyltransferase Ste14